MDAQLPQRLDEVLEAITDPQFAMKLRRVIEAAALAIDRLGHLSLVKLEPVAAEEGSADLSQWETMAPAVRDTVVDVNALLKVIDAEFRNRPQPITEFASFSDDRSQAEAAMTFRAVAGQLERGVNEVGGMARNPELVSSRWALLAELQRLRAAFRARIGDAVYLSAAACRPVRREEVVPGYAQELMRAALFRSTTADVRRNVAEKLAKLTLPPQEGAKSVDIDFDIFATLPAWKYVRAEPKRQMLWLRQALQQAATDPALTRGQLEVLVEPALELLRRLSDEQSQTILPTHDRSVRAQAELLLEQAQLHLQLETGAAASTFGRAVAASDGLYGRDQTFDALLRTMRSKSPHELSIDELKEHARQLGQMLSLLEI